MDNETKQLIDEALNKFFKSAPGREIKKGIRPEYYDICPHCKTEIYERHEYTDDGGKTWRHSECKGLIYHSINESEAVPGMPPSGEEKYSKQEPGGTMSAVNIAEDSSEEEETQILSPKQAAKFFGGQCIVMNKTQHTVMAKCTRLQTDIKTGGTYSAFYTSIQDV